MTRTPAEAPAESRRLRPGAGADRARAPAYLMPLFWATLCRDRRDTAEMTCGRQQRRSVTPGRLTKRPWTRRTAHGARFPCGRRATAERSPAQAPALRLAYCVLCKCVTSAPRHLQRRLGPCRSRWHRGSQQRPPTHTCQKKGSEVLSGEQQRLVLCRPPALCPVQPPPDRGPPASQPLRPSTVIPQALGTTGSERAPGPADDNGDAEAGRGTRLPPSRA